MSDSVIPVYWDTNATPSNTDSGSTKGALSAVSTVSDQADLASDIIYNYNVKSKYNSNKNMYLFLLIFFVIGNSAPYYYFENLKNKNAWPSKGFGGLLRKIIVHVIGYYFFMALIKYIWYSGKIMYNLNDLECTYIEYSTLPNIPLSTELDKDSGSSTLLLVVSNANIVKIEDIIANDNMYSLTQALKLIGIIIQNKPLPDLNVPLYPSTAITSEERTAASITQTITLSSDNKTKTGSSNIPFYVTVIFTILFANIITLKGYPVYGVTYFYNPFYHVFRGAEMIGYFLGNPDLMIKLNETLNTFVDIHIMEQKELYMIVIK